MSDSRWQQAARLPGFDRVFGTYLTWLFRRSFATIWIASDAAALPRTGYIAAPNHSSWWDGFIGHFLHRRSNDDSAFAIMMSDRELRRFPFFRWLGAFSVDTASVRTAREAVIYAAAQATQGAGVWIFPQGTIVRGASHVAFTSGFVHAAHRAGAPIVPVAIRYAMRDRQRPEVFIDLGTSVTPSSSAREEVQAIVVRMLASIDRALDEDTVAERFVPLLSESPGVDARISRAIEIVRRR